MTVIPLNARSAQKLAELHRAPMPATRVLSPEARQAFASLKGLIGMLDRSFSGSFVSVSAADEIAHQCDEIRYAAQRVARLSR